MSLSEFLFGKWEVVESIPAEYKRRVLWMESEEEGEIRIEKNLRTGYERARLVGWQSSYELDLNFTKQKIREYKLENKE
jgi:hypothetical protein